MDVPVSTIQAFFLNLLLQRMDSLPLPHQVNIPKGLSLQTIKLFLGFVVFSPRVTGQLSQNILRMGPERSLVAAEP